MKKNKTLCLQGAHVRDRFLSAQTVVEPKDIGVLLKHLPSDQIELIPTDRPPTPGAKVVALESLSHLDDSPFVGKEKLGGGVLNAALGAAKEVRSRGLSITIKVVSSGPVTPDLANLCSGLDIQLHCLGRVGCSRNLIVPWDGDRLIIREPVASCPPGLDDHHVTTLEQVLSGADAIASVSSRDHSVVTASLALALANGGGCYYQPSAGGGLDRAQTLHRLATVTGVVGNFADLVGLARAVNLPPPGCTEEAPEAVGRAVTILTELHRRGLAGREFAVVTLGKRGSVVGDWKRGRVYRIAVEILADRNGQPGHGVATPPGTGDVFLAHYLLYRELWASADHLRDPEAAAAVRASIAVAKMLGLRRDQYDVRVIPLAIL